MRTIRREKGVLKLVHPGRYIEILREPVTAQEVMKRNPRHCITRPDVFEFPWIVVKPESILLPGRVYFIVPFRTIYNLIKTRNPSSQNHQNPHGHQQTSLVLYAKHQTLKPFITCVPGKKCLSIESTARKQPRVEILNKMTRYIDTQMRIEQKLHGESMKDMRADNALDNKKDDTLEIVSNEQATKLKSCFRKADSIRRMLDHKVSFYLPVETEEKQEDYSEVLQNFQAFEIGDTSI